MDGKEINIYETIEPVILSWSILQYLLIHKATFFCFNFVTRNRMLGGE